MILGKGNEWRVNEDLEGAGLGISGIGGKREGI
jgi:hypothetical protein